MQFYLDGFYPGDPSIRPAVEKSSAERVCRDEVDVLIVGCGPAGLILAAQLAQFPEIKTRIIERKMGPLELGQADGVACRSVEMFEAFGLSSALMDEAAWVTETVFWGPDPDDRSRIVRTGRVRDVEDGLSEFPHLIVNQARIHAHLLDSMRKSASRLEPRYGSTFVGLTVADSGDHPVEVTLRPSSSTDPVDEYRVYARYVVGCDGARSAVRGSMGLTLQGDSASQVWGVMDVLAVTDIPDIRYKMVIQSADDGNIVVIPREGGYLVRFYIELGELDRGERVSDREISQDTLIAAAQRILHPYSLDVRQVVWWSAYEIGQRLTERFDLPDRVSARGPRVFIAGDACHTHSPKAGQGMNVSMQDGFNLGWKLAAVLTRRAAPSLLETYSTERHDVAQRLIDFDREWARMFGAPPAEDGDKTGVTPAQLQQHFAEQGRYTAGVATHYRPSVITGGDEYQRLATGFVVGERFHSAPVVRISDAKPLQLGHVAEADGRWRLYAFADERALHQEDSRLRRLLHFLENDPTSPVCKFRRQGEDIDAVLDVRAIVQESHDSISFDELPSLLRPRKGVLELIDYEKAFSPNLRDGVDIFELRGIDRVVGATVIVRPDQYVAAILPLDATDRITSFFEKFLVDTR